jgi:hypothetical protein
MRDIRSDLKERLATLDAERTALKQQLVALDKSEFAINALLTSEDMRFAPTANMDLFSTPPEVDAGTTPLAKFLLLTLRSADRALSLDEIKVAAEAANFDFEDKSPGRVIHYALVGMTQNGSVVSIGDLWRIKEGN